MRYAFLKMMHVRDTCDFSFSGLKTADVARLRDLGGPPKGADLADFCESVQHAIAENLLDKAFRAIRLHHLDQLVLAGGVAANRQLRARATMRGANEGVRVFLPSRAYCTDNAAMIARAGLERLSKGERHGLDLQARPHWRSRENRSHRALLLRENELHIRAALWETSSSTMRSGEPLRARVVDDGRPDRRDRGGSGTLTQKLAETGGGHRRSRPKPRSDPDDARDNPRVRIVETAPSTSATKRFSDLRAKGLRRWEPVHNISSPLAFSMRRFLGARP